MNARLATVGDELFGETVLFIKQLPSVIAKICKQIMEPQKKITEFRLVVIPTPLFSY